MRTSGERHQTTNGRAGPNKCTSTRKSHTWQIWEDEVGTLTDAEGSQGLGEKFLPNACVEKHAGRGHAEVRRRLRGAQGEGLWQHQMPFEKNRLFLRPPSRGW